MHPPLLLALLLPTLAPAQADPVLESRAESRAAGQAYQAKDYAAFLAHARRAHSLRPAHGGVTYALAAASALTGDTAGALDALRHFAALGYWADVAADSDLAGLHGSAGFQDLVQRLGRNREPIVRSRPAVTLPERDLLVEGIAYDPRERAFYLSSVHRRSIFRLDREGTVTRFAGPESVPWAPLGLRVDPARRTLWVASAALPQADGYASADSGRSGVLRFELGTGKLARRYDVPRDGQSHVVGDLLITSKGDVLATDSRAPVIYRIAAGADTLERFVELPLLLSAQGLALTPDQRTLYVADYARGILRVELGDHRVSLLTTADSVLALGLDGLYLHRGRLVAIQNGVAPHRVVRFDLDPTGNRLIRAEVMERNHPEHGEPTLGVIVGNDLVYVANSQWERFGEDGRIAHPDSLQPTVALRLPL